MRKIKATLVCFVIVVLVFTNIFGIGFIINNLSSNTIGFNGIMSPIEVFNGDPLKNKIINLDYPYFTLKAIVTETDDHKPLKIMNHLKDDLKQIGIGLDIYELDWSSMTSQLIALYEFDICYVGLTGGGFDPDFTGVYDENGSLNLFGYDTSMDWDEGLGTGINEWYMDQGTLIMPPDSSERVQHYWEWEDHLMEEILPSIPLTTFYDYCVQYSNLVGFDFKDGLIQSWGKMSWDDYHLGQSSLEELVVAKPQWDDLNPLFMDDTTSEFIASACMDPLVWFDSNASCWPHILSDWTHINDTHVRLSVREDIKWQNDSEDIFTDEYVTADDVYFTLYCMKHLSDDHVAWEWLEDITIIDDYTVDIFIDLVPWTIENEPFNYLPSLNTYLLPEHYLNQTQIFDGVTPDITHVSWSNFGNHTIGTGILQFNNSIEGVNTNLTRFDDCWKLDPVVTADPNLDFTQRFGDIWGINDLQIKHDILEENIQYEFNIGSIDLYEFSDTDYENNEYYFWDPQFIVKSKAVTRFSFFGFNMREERGTPMQSRDPCFLEPTLTQGLAIRKAIAYAFNKIKMVEYALDTPQQLCYHPIYNTLEIWLSPTINKYEYDFDLALNYMLLAGFDLNYDSDGDGFSDFEELNVYQTDPYDENDFPPGPFFGITILCPDSNPMRIETAILFATELPKIGICVEDFIVTDWTHIGERTWGHPGPYPIPTFEEGGFDMLFVGWSHYIHFKMGEVFLSDQAVPFGDNFYQFSNETYDLTFDAYRHSYENVDKILLAKEVQSILHEELPSIPTIYSKEFYAFDDNLVGYDLRQWYHTSKGIENWVISGQTEFHYATPYMFNNAYIITATRDNFKGDLQWLRQIYDGLLYREPSTNLLTPRIATSCTTTDGLIYHITLNPTIYWADGTPVTAADVNYSYSLHSFYDWWIDHMIDSITIINDYELEITLTEGDAFDQEIFTREILPKHIWEGIGSEFQHDIALDWAINHPERIFGTGPYKLGDYDSLNSIIHLTKNSYFEDWNYEAYFEDLYLHNYYSKDLALDDLNANIIDMIDSQLEMTIEDLEYYGVAYDSAINGLYQEIALNNLHPYYGTGESCPIVGEDSAKYIRKALCHLVDREKICDEIYNGTANPATSHYPPLSDLFNDELIPCEYNLQTAKVYMGMAGFYIDTDGDGLTDVDEVTKYYTDPQVADADLDSDSDGLTNVDEVDIYLTDPLDADTDSDGLTDGEEVLTYTTDPNDSDTDGDGLIDGDEVNLYDTDPLVADADLDSDSDGLTNVEEVDIYLTDPHDEDTDSDGLIDGDEVDRYYTDPLVSDIDLDSDSDGLTNVEEVDTYHTDPLDEDSEDDGMPDGWEVDNSLDPLVDDADDDEDSDGLTNLQEYNNGTDPRDEDTDNDLMPDEWEVDNALDPLVDDADDDEDSDGLDNYGEYLEGTDPNDSDTDGDGLEDGDELDLYYTDPTVADADLDSDSDGLTNVEEVDIYMTNPLDNDTDDDTLSDGDEVNVYHTNPCNSDSDNDTIPDCEEVIPGTDGYVTDPNEADTDGDGIDDAEEIANGTDPTDPEDPPTSSPTPTETTTTTDTGGFGFLLLVSVFLLGMFGFIFIRKNRK